MTMELLRVAKLITLSAAITLAACGGGGGSSSGGETTTPGGETTPPDGGTTSPGSDTSDGTPAASIARTSNGCTITQATGGFQDKGLIIEEANWIQVVQQNVTDAKARLVANKALRLRIDVTAPTAGKPMPASATLRVALSSGGCKDYSLTTSATTAPTTIDRSVLTRSYVAVIPAADVTNNLKSVQIAIDPERQSTQAAANRLYLELPLNIEAEISEEVIIFPIVFQGVTGSFVTESALATLVSRSLPQQKLTLTTQPAFTSTVLLPSEAQSVSASGVYTFDKQHMRDALNEIENDCYALNPPFAKVSDAIKCAAAYPDNIRFVDGSSEIVGIANVGSLAMLSLGFTEVDNLASNSPYGAPWITYGASTFIHELSHVMSLNHANCGGAAGIDPALYSDGTLGNGGGFDVERGFYFSGPAGGFYDVMSYCGTKLWTSDRGYQKIVEYKLSNISAPTSGSARMSSTDTEAPREQKGIRLVRMRGVWKANLAMIPATAVDSVHATDGGYISATLKGLPIKALDSDLGQNVNGPFFIPANDQLINSLAKGLIPGVTLN